MVCSEPSLLVRTLPVRTLRNHRQQVEVEKERPKRHGLVLLRQMLLVWQVRQTRQVRQLLDVLLMLGQRQLLDVQLQGQMQQQRQEWGCQGQVGKGGGLLKNVQPL